MTNLKPLCLCCAHIFRSQIGVSAHLSAGNKVAPSSMKMSQSWIRCTSVPRQHCSRGQYLNCSGLSQYLTWVLSHSTRLGILRNGFHILIPSRDNFWFVRSIRFGSFGYFFSVLRYSLSVSKDMRACSKLLPLPGFAKIRMNQYFNAIISGVKS